MNLTNGQKVGSLVAVLAVVVLGVDRFVLGGGPSSATAAPAVTGTEPIAVEQSAVPAVGGSDLAARLSEFAAAESLDPSGLVPDLFGSEPEAEAWTVQSVFGTGRRAGVRVDDRTITVGGEHRGATLVRVAREGAYFSAGGREFFAPLENLRDGSERPDGRHDR